MTVFPPPLNDLEVVLVGRLGRNKHQKPKMVEFSEQPADTKLTYDVSFSVKLLPAYNR